ncbi:hypothetical protein SAMD00023353_0300010 [Rosellinia necatrix]|uniref:Uncharacterized protein n=1 Tax=Rosellinia necatrix TaxID=77044 RepID=A0A1S8A526_ROSNE|nr:hypothetical protein SAMD00023353_0300010 [Rosellinia necatrix]
MLDSLTSNPLSPRNNNNFLFRVSLPDSLPGDQLDGAAHTLPISNCQLFANQLHLPDTRYQLLRRDDDADGGVMVAAAALRFSLG